MSHTSMTNPGAHAWVLKVANEKLLEPKSDKVFQLASAAAPIKTGELKGEMYKERVDDKTIRIGSHSDHTLVVELGSRPHLIWSHGPWSLHNHDTGQYFGRVVAHPGTLPQPFLRPALYAAGGM